MGDCDDDFVSCPYDLTHRVRRSKLPLHVAKCEWLNPELIACPYNIWHRYTQRDMPAHIRVCSSKPIPQDFVAEFQKNVSQATIDQGIERGNYAAADVAEARALAYPIRPSAGPPETYRPRTSFYVPRAYIPRTPRMSSMSLVRGHHIRNFDDVRDRPPQ